MFSHTFLQIILWMRLENVFIQQLNLMLKLAKCFCNWKVYTSILRAYNPFVTVIEMFIIGVHKKKTNN